MNFQTIPVLRSFDEEKAKAFYVGFLGMRVDWEHRFAENMPLYMQVSKGNLVFHLSEHAGDCTPGSKVFVNTANLDELHQEISAKNYPYSRPDIEMAVWGDRAFTVIDPFSNRIVFNQKKIDPS
jgi:uncharacterized glyoxalase superfamily protein PhnB